jgi:hypothetical protein
MTTDCIKQEFGVYITENVVENVAVKMKEKFSDLGKVNAVFS